MTEAKALRADYQRAYRLTLKAAIAYLRKHGTFLEDEMPDRLRQIVAQPGEAN
jgi:hypothetical protein